MTNRENALAMLRYQKYDRVPLVHFGYWTETVLKWAKEGHLPNALADKVNYGTKAEDEVSSLLGFDFGWYNTVGGATGLYPAFERQVLETYPDGRIKVRNASGALVVEKPGTVSIPGEVGHTLEDRASYDKLVEPKLRWTEDRLDIKGLDRLAKAILEKTIQPNTPADRPVGLWLGSLYGCIRDMLGMENCAYLAVDDPELYKELIDRIGSLAYSLVDATLKEAAKRKLRFDFGHMWEDICFKNGPLISPVVFEEFVGPWYKKITDRARQDGVELVSLDCDGCIDALLPIWLKNGVNVMFPIEVGTWRASIAPWRKKYGKDIRGVGGMDKVVFSKDKAAVDTEIERLKALVDLGGFIPCPDHRIAPDAEWDNVRYYCDAFRKVFG